jgi:hypothetical protein
MVAWDQVKHQHVLAAIGEYDRLGQEEFLEKYHRDSPSSRSLGKGRGFEDLPSVPFHVGQRGQRCPRSRS